MNALRLSPPDWGLSSVIALVHSLSTGPVESTTEPTVLLDPNSRASFSSCARTDNTNGNDGHQLGNFETLWKFLGAPLDTPAPVVYPAAVRGILTDENFRVEEYKLSASKGVAREDGLKGSTSNNAKPQEETTTGAPPTKLSKKQRKLLKRELKKQLRRSSAQIQPLNTTSGDDEDPESTSSQLRKSSNRQQVIQKILNGNPKSLKDRKLPKSPKVVKIAKVAAQPEPKTPTPGPLKYRLRNRNVFEKNGVNAQKTPLVHQAPASTALENPRTYMNQDLAKPQISNQPTADLTPVIPACQTPPKPATGLQPTLDAYQTPNRPIGGLAYALAASPTPKRPTEGSAWAVGMFEKALELTNDPTMALRTYHQALLVEKLEAQFPSERPNFHPLNTSVTLEPHGIHVFVDASNITIGFHDALKLAHSLPLSTRLPRQPFSFEALALILERGRPCAKRVLGGSDNFPAVDAARAIGYECNIMDRVHKAKILTERQRYFAERDAAASIRRRRGGGDYRSATSGLSGGSGTDEAVVAPEGGQQQQQQQQQQPQPPSQVVAEAKWVEQGVDEILHLKMMESVVDTDVPSTIVLATGDAAAAEYSGGFLCMAERALKKGWRVEVVSFRRNLNGAWRNREWRERWGERFMVVELEAFVLELSRA